MDRKRSIAYGTIILGLALGSGQWLGGDEPSAPQPSAETVPDAPRSTQSARVEDMRAPPEFRQTANAAPSPLAPAQISPAQISQVVPVAALADPPAEADLTGSAAPTDACTPALDLIAEPDAMIGVTLVSPCHPDARVVLSHGGLTITARATATGSVFTSLPALDIAGEVSALFPDGTRQTAALTMPELADLRRFAVQWQADDTLALTAFADDADAAPVAQVTLETLPAGDSVTGKVVTLGDGSVSLPMLAQVYTYPADARPALTVEAQVTAATCGRELLGETLNSTGGRVEVRDLTLPMPGCDAMGEFLVLNIPAPDLTLAAVE